MIVAGPEGYIKSAYRKFTIRSTAANDPATPGDDYAMMREVLTRRFSRLIKEDPGRSGESWPDLVLIDGGAGQLGEARRVFADLGIADLAVAAIAKGPERNAGRERVFLPDQPPVALGARDPLLYFLQRLRDEAHRFAIGTHRSKRAKARVPLGARRDSGRRPPAQEGATPPLRLGARGEPGGTRRSRDRRRHIERGCARDP